MAPTLFTSRNALPPEGAELRLGRPGASFMAPTPVASRSALLTGVLAFLVTDVVLQLPVRL